MFARLQSNCWSTCEGIAERGGGADEPGVLVRLWYSVCSIIIDSAHDIMDDIR